MSVLLKVGNIYRNRLGETVMITNKVILTTHAYEASDGDYYRYNGRRSFFKDHDLDLIEEADVHDAPRAGEWTDFIAGIFDGSYSKAA